MPFVIGLTGSIGMGKSTTSDMFREQGIPVWDADDAVNRLYSRGGEAVSAIRSEFPQAVIDGVVCKDTLKNLIASDAKVLRRLENIVHPLVRRDREAFLAQTPHPIVVLDIPLLFETGSAEDFDLVVVVSAPAETQKERVMARPGMTEAQFELINSKQMPDAQKRQSADLVISTMDMDTARDGVLKTLAMAKERTENA